MAKGCDARAKHYNYFRDYDPSIGRYIQSDPIGLQGGLSTYSYVGGNPLIHFDLWGLACQYMGYTAYPGTEHRTEDFEHRFDSRGGPFPNWGGKPGCNWWKFLPPIFGRGAGLSPPCKPDFIWKDYDLMGRGIRQLSRDYEDQDHLYVCDPKGCGDDGIKHMWVRKAKGDWKVDFTHFESLDWVKR